MSEEESRSASRVTIGHASDLHLPLEHSVPPSALVGKRLLGWANARLVRQKAHRAELAAEVLAHLARARPDLVILTGDLVSLALGFEYARVDRLLREAGLEPERTLLLPGNHDRYTPEADRDGAFERGLAAWLPGGFRRGDWPRVLRAGPVTVLGVDTAVWRGPHRAAGRIDAVQLERLAVHLRLCRREGRHPVVALHHPPFRLADSPLHHYQAGLEGHRRLAGLIDRHAATCLCGHLHRLERRRIGQARAICAPSASLDGRSPLSQAGYHLYTFDAAGLRAARGVRCWPRQADPARRFQSVELPID